MFCSRFCGCNPKHVCGRRCGCLISRVYPRRGHLGSSAQCAPSPGHVHCCRPNDCETTDVRGARGNLVAKSVLFSGFLSNDTNMRFQHYFWRSTYQEHTCTMCHGVRDPAISLCVGLVRAKIKLLNTMQPRCLHNRTCWLDRKMTN